MLNYTFLMVNRILVGSLFAFTLLLGTPALAQKPEPTPNTKRLTRLGTLASSVEDELLTSEVEPRTKRFKMNIRFLRARYSHQDLAKGTIGQQNYEWFYFPEVSFSLSFYRYPFGTFSLKSTAEGKTQAAQLLDADFERIKVKKLSEKDISIGKVSGKEYEVLLDATKMRVRTFIDGDFRYVLIAQPKREGASPLIDKLFNSFEFVAPDIGASVENGVFVSKGGKFSIAIQQMPKQIVDQAKGKALDEGIDVGKTFVWIFEKTLYTIYYNPPVDPDGTPRPQDYVDIETGTRKGALNGGAKITSEKRISYGKYRGTEFLYELPNGVKYIGKTYLIGDIGYQVVGAYADEAHKKEVLDVLASFKPLEPKP